jgi:hypothetical protein
MSFAYVLSCRAVPRLHSWWRTSLVSLVLGWLLGSGVGRAEDFFGLQTMPTFNQEHALTVRVTDRTKLTVRIHGITVKFVSASGQECSLSSNTELSLQPGDEETVLIADSDGVDRCLSRIRAPFTATSAVLFAPLASSDQQARNALTVTIDTRLSESDRAYEHRSSWRTTTNR